MPSEVFVEGECHTYFGVAVRVKYRFSLGIVTQLPPCNGLCPAFPISNKRFKILEIALSAISMASVMSASLPSPLVDQLLSKLLIQLNAFVKTTQASKECT